MLAPKRVKYRKMQKGRIRGKESRATELSFGSFGLKALEAKWIKARQIEAARRALLRYLKKGGKMWLRMFPDKPITSKGTEFSMGGGKGSVQTYVFCAKPGRILFEVDGLKEELAIEALRTAANKLPLKTKIVKK
jgi:large subunit ribosomal protein L16